MVSRHVRHATHGFTLVELLVVIGIIALLISILLPSLNRARQSALTVSCANNMRQLGLTMNMFANDHRQHWPATIVYGSDNTWHLTWDDAIAKYFHKDIPETDQRGQLMPKKFDIGVLHCPADNVERDSWVATFGGYPRSYSMVVIWNGVATAAGSETYGAGKYNYQTDSLEGNGVGKVGSDTFLLVEAHRSGNAAGNVSGSGVDQVGAMLSTGQIPAHNGKLNWLYIDGHVEQIVPSESGWGVLNWANGMPYGSWSRRAND